MTSIKALWADRFSDYYYCYFVISGTDSKFLLYNFFWNSFNVDIEIYMFENSSFVYA